MTGEDLFDLPLYVQAYEKIQAAEEDRIYCKHDREHFARVAKLMSSLVRKNGLEISEDEIMAAAYLHDIGRAEEYQSGRPHDLASVEMAELILRQMLVEKDERDRILQAIARHRSRRAVSDVEKHLDKIRDLPSLLAFADQFSRDCYCCAAAGSCRWREEEKIRSRIDENWKSCV